MRVCAGSALSRGCEFVVFDYAAFRMAWFKQVSNAFCKYARTPLLRAVLFINIGMDASHYATQISFFQILFRFLCVFSKSADLMPICLNTSATFVHNGERECDSFPAPALMGVHNGVRAETPKITTLHTVSFITFSFKFVPSIASQENNESFAKRVQLHRFLLAPAFQRFFSIYLSN